MAAVFDFRGRLSRRQFLVGLAVGYLTLVLAVLALVGLARLTSVATGVRPLHLAPGFAVLVAGASILVQLRCLVPRFHDFGWSGWAPGSAMLAAVLLNTRLGSELPDLLDTAVIVPLWLAAAIVPGRRGDNRYGPAPSEVGWERASPPAPDPALFAAGRSPPASGEGRSRAAD